MTINSFDFIIHNEVSIAAEPAKVWPYILDINSWRTAGPRLLHDSGEAGAVGERFKAVSESETGSFHYYVVNVEILPERRRTIRLDTPAGDLIGYATWTLTPADGGTRLEYHVYCQDELPCDADGVPAKDAILRMGHQRVAEGFTDLKQLIET